MERERLYFDPQLADRSRLDRPVLTNKIDGRPAWKDVYSEWWAGATISSPHIKAALAADKTLRRIRTLVGAMEKGDEDAIDMLNREYRQQADACRLALLRVLQTDGANVVLETNGTSAISLARSMINVSDGEEILTTNEEGNVVFPALLGRDPWNYPSMFEENVRLFTRHKPLPIDHSVRGEPSVHAIKMLGDNDIWKTNSQILKEIDERLHHRPVKLVMIPHVTKTGRILPVQKIGEIIKDINSRTNRQIAYIVDGVQALGRTDARSLYKPLEYCDFYIATSSKALGGILISAGLVTKSETLRKNLPNLLHSSYARHLRHYQFPEDYSEIENLLAQRSEHQAISLPEISSFSYVLEDFYTRGEGKIFEERRRSQLRRVQKIRDNVVSRLSNIRGIKIYEGGGDAPIVPSIITFIHNEISAKEMKTQLQNPQLGPIVTPSANVGRLMRLEIPEYRPVPNIEVLIEKLQRIVG